MKDITVTILKTIVRGWVGIAALVNVHDAGAAAVTWNSWTFDYEISGNYDGLSLKNLTYQGHTLIYKINIPVIRVFYDNNVCGPYADRLGGTLSPIPWANNATVAQREFTLDGRQWYEIGIRDQIGNYDLYQVFYLSADGIFDAHIYSKGLQCVVDHVHYPNWRIDFDVDGAANDVLEHNDGTGFQTDNIEFNSRATTAIEHGWRVRDANTGLYVDILPGFSGFSIPDGSATVPVEDYTQNTVFGRLYHATEDTGWTYGPNTQVPFNDYENILNADLVAWYEAYMPHSAAEGSVLWHSTGIRLVSSLTDTKSPSTPMNLSATAASSSQVNLSWSDSTDNVGVTGYLLERCQDVDCANFQLIATVAGTTFTDTGLTTNTNYTYQVRARDAAGNLSGASTPVSIKTLAVAPLCTVNESFASIADNKVVYQLTDSGTTQATLTTFVLNFPSNYASIKEIRLGGTSIFKSSATVPAVGSGNVINSWTNPDITKRQMSPGASKKLEIFFSNKWPKANCPNGMCFTGTSSFAPGCSVDFVYNP